MGKKKETISLVDTFSEFNELKNIDKTTMISVLEESFRSVIAKINGTDENYDIIINPDKGDLEIWRNRKVVEDDKLQWVRAHQDEIRADLYQGLADAVADDDAAGAGVRVVLPSTVNHSPLNLHQKFQDAMAMVRACAAPLQNSMWSGLAGIFCCASQEQTTSRWWVRP